MPSHHSRTGKTHRFDIIIGKNLQRLRADAGISQQALGKHLGLTFQQIQKYEKGANRLAAERLVIISELFGIEIGEFFEGIKISESAEDHLAKLHEDILIIQRITAMPEAYRNTALTFLRELSK